MFKLCIMSLQIKKPPSESLDGSIFVSLAITGVLAPYCCFFCCARHGLYTFYQLENQCIPLDASLGVISMAGLTYPCYLEQKDNRGQWYWIYYAVNGEAISRSSESYVNRSDCEHSISLMKNSSASTIFKTE